MPVALFAGPEPYRRYPVQALLAEHAPTVLDADESLSDAVSALGAGTGLFGPVTLHVTSAGRLQEAKDLGALLRDYPGLVVLEADTATAKLEKALPAGSTVEKYTTTGAGAVAGMRAAASALGVEAPLPVINDILKRTGSDPAHCVNVLVACAAAGFPSVTSGHARALSVAAEEESLPWILLDRLVAASPAGLVDVLETSEAIGTLAFLSKRYLVTAVLAEGGSAQQLDDLIGSVTEAAQRDAARQVKLLPAGGTTRILAALAQADRLAKTGHGPSALTIASAAIRSEREGSHRP